MLQKCDRVTEIERRIQAEGRALSRHFEARAAPASAEDICSNRHTDQFIDILTRNGGSCNHITDDEF